MRIIKQGKGDSRNLLEIDKWMLSRLQTYIKEANTAMKELRVRKAIHAALYDLNQDLDWYLRRISKDREKNERTESIKYIEWSILDTQIRLLTPFTPHLCEEIWEAMNGKGFIAFADWPEVNINLIRLESEELERIIQNSVEDIKNIIKVTGITPKKIHFYTADGWKWKIYLQALELSKKENLNVGTLIKNAFRDDEMKVRSKLVPRFARGVVEDVIKLPDNILEQRLKLKHINEVNVLQDSIDFLEKEFNCDISVSMESDPWINDPAKRAYRSKPYKPALFVE
jgi:leucyl-tRNA synthetase